MGAIRQPQPAAPLFFSTADHAPDDHDQDVQDIYALKSSRRFFGTYGPSNMGDDGEGEGSGMGSSLTENRPSQQNIRSSWRPTSQEIGEDSAMKDSHMSKGKARMVDVGLEDSDEALLNNSELLGMMPEEIDYSDMVGCLVSVSNVC